MLINRPNKRQKNKSMAWHGMAGAEIGARAAPEMDRNRSPSLARPIDGSTGAQIAAGSGDVGKQASTRRARKVSAYARTWRGAVDPRREAGERVPLRGADHRHREQREGDGRGGVGPASSSSSHRPDRPSLAQGLSICVPARRGSASQERREWE